jgi:hypothetical protein
LSPELKKEIIINHREIWDWIAVKFEGVTEEQVIESIRKLPK